MGRKKRRNRKKSSRIPPLHKCIQEEQKEAEKAVRQLPRHLIQRATNANKPVKTELSFISWYYTDQDGMPRQDRRRRITVLVHSDGSVMTPDRYCAGIVGEEDVRHVICPDMLPSHALI